jgi:hypothetical protein
MILRPTEPSPVHSGSSKAQSDNKNMRDMFHPLFGEKKKKNEGIACFCPSTKVKWPTSDGTGI